MQRTAFRVLRVPDDTKQLVLHESPISQIQRWNFEYLIDVRRHTNIRLRIFILRLLTFLLESEKYRCLDRVFPLTPLRIQPHTDRVMI